MSKPYNVDDILKEIKDKKSKQTTTTPASPWKETGTRTQRPAPKNSASPRSSSAKDNELFFSSLTAHRQAELKKEADEKEKFLAIEEERRRREAEAAQKAKAEQQRRQQESEQFRASQAAQSKKAESPKNSVPAPEPKSSKVKEDTGSFFLEQQPADLPETEGETPFGDFEPTVPTPEQEASAAEGQSEYQKFFSKKFKQAKEDKKVKRADDSALKAESTTLFDTSAFDITDPPRDGAPITLNDPVLDEEDELLADLEENPAPEISPVKQKNSKNQTSKKKKEIVALTTAEIPIPEEFKEEENTSPDELEDYTSPKDKEAVLHDIQSIKTGLLVRTVLIVVLFGISLYLSLAARDIQIGDELLPLPTFIQPELHLQTYMIVSCLLPAIGALICSNTVGGGLIALLKFKANTDSLPTLAVLGTLAQGMCYIIKPELFSVNKADFGTNLYLFFPLALFILLFNLIGKIFVILRIQNNFRVVASERPKRAAVFLRDRTLLRELSRGLSMEEYTIAYPESTKLLAGFLDNSYSEDHAENMSRVLAPICLLAGVLMSLLSYLFNKNAADAVSTFTAIMCVCAPLTSTLAANLPLYRMSSHLVPSGAMVSGYSAIEAFANTEGVIMDAKDLFHPSDVMLHGIKPFDQSQIDSVILDAASVMCNTDGMLTDVFNKIIGSDRSMLRPVENVTYEDSMGLSAWVDGKRVLIGNRELMVNHGVEVPSSDYEMRFVKDSKNIVYLSNSGELSAMFVISYRPNDATQKQLDELAERELNLIIKTSDPNITAEKINSIYSFPLDQIKLMPAKFHTSYEQLTAEKESSPAKIGFIGSSRNMVNAILECISVKTSIDQAVLIQMIAVVVGYGLVSLFSLMGNLSYLSVGHLILFQIIWAAIGILVPNLKLHK